MEMGQLDVHDVPGLGIQLLTPRWIESSFGLLHQLIVALVVPASQALRIVALGMQVAAKKPIRVETVAVPLNQAVEIALLLGLAQRHGIERLDVHLEAHTGPQLLDDLSALTVVGQIGVTDELDSRPYCPGLFEQGLGFLRVVFEAPTPLQVPGVAGRIDLIEHMTLLVEHRIVEGLAINGVCRGGAYDLVLERTLTKVKNYEDTPEVESPDVVLVTVALLKALHVRVGHVIHQVNLSGEIGRA